MKRFSFLLALLTFAFSVQLQAQIDENETGLLWAINGPDQKETSYLFGTIHMIPAEDFAISDATKTALEKSERVAFEIDTREMQNPANLLGIMDQLFMADNLTLKDLLTEDEYKEVNDHFSKTGLPLTFFQRMKPMFLSVMADVDLQSFGQEGSDIKSYEFELTDIATSAEKEIFGLETMEFQLGLFDSIPYEEQADMLLAAIRSENDTDSKGQFDRMVELYKSEKINEMVNMMREEESGMNGNIEEMLLLKRNRAWIPLMGEAMKESSVFFAVGAGHLGGEEGVISLLRKAGYTVEAVN